MRTGIRSGAGFMAARWLTTQEVPLSKPLTAAISLEPQRRVTEQAGGIFTSLRLTVMAIRCGQKPMEQGAMRSGILLRRLLTVDSFLQEFPTQIISEQLVIFI